MSHDHTPIHSQAALVATAARPSHGDVAMTQHVIAKQLTVVPAQHSESLSTRLGGQPGVHQPKAADLRRLLAALDACALASSSADSGSELAMDVEQALARLACFERGVGALATASPYLQYLRRTVAQAEVTNLTVRSTLDQQLAASA